MLRRVIGYVIIVIGGLAILYLSYILLGPQKTNQSDLGTPPKQVPTTGQDNTSINTGQDQTGLDTGIDTRPSTGVDMGSLTGDNKLIIAFPRRLYSADVDQFLLELEQTYNRNIEIKAVDDPRAYQTLLQEKFLKTNEIDIALIPSDWFLSFQKEGLFMQQTVSVETLFHQSFYDLISDTQATFIPYMIDPLVTRARQKSLDNPQPTRKDLRLFVYNNPNRRVMPLLRGLDRQDNQFLASGNETWPSQATLTKYVIQNAINQDNPEPISIFAKLSSTHLSGGRSSSFLIDQVKQFTKQEPKCDKEPIACLLLFEQADIAIVPLSQARQQKMMKGRSDDDRQILPFPSVQQNYPVRGRGFLINHKTDQPDQSKQLINNYLKKGINQTIDFWPDTISPFIRHQEQQGSKPQRSHIVPRSNQWTMIVDGWESQQAFFNSINLDTLINPDYDPLLRIQQYK